MTTSASTVETTPSATLRSRWLEALLPSVADLGWTETAARQAAASAGLSPGEQALAAPGGVDDLIQAFFDGAEDEARAGLAGEDLDDLPMHRRVARGIRVWLDTLEPHRAAVARASARGFWPTRSSHAAARCWSVADMVWEAAGDTAEDYNRYTKRGLLAATVPPIVLYWQRGPESDALDEFIARRLKTAMQVGQTGARFAKPLLDRFLSGRSAGPSTRPGPQPRPEPAGE
ncbi:MAG: COQ9 family protein [Pseudomonadota bacterium]